MKALLKPLGELEQIVMDVVWSHGCATVRCVYVEVQIKRDIAYTTVMTTMDRLAKKKILKRIKVGKAYEYTPVCSCAELNTRTSRSIIDQLLKNYGDLAIAQFIGVLDTIDPKKLEELKRQAEE